MKKTPKMLKEAREIVDPDSLRVTRPDDAKLRELILHISIMCEGDPSYGSVKLNKLLFFADFVAYMQLGESITGQEYQALEQGPVPRRLLPIRTRMEKEEELALREQDFYGMKQDRPLALRQPDLSDFTAEQIAVVDHLVLAWWGITASRMSDVSHAFAGWQFANRGETIPYEVSLVGDRQPTAEERKRGAELADLAKECLAGNAG